MAYSDDAVKAKLNSLNETQDSIVANAQWIMFHRRHADRTATQWLARLQEASIPKRLVLVYLANEVVQQSRARGKQDFLLAFEPVIAEATSLAYKGASSDVQGKLRRVVEVWRQRSIFDKRILDTVEQRLDELDKQRGSKIGGGGKLGGSLFGGSGGASAELDGVRKSQAATTKADAMKTPVVSTARTEYTKLSDPNAEVPNPPVHAAKLSGIMKTLATAQSAVEAGIKARQELIAGLAKLLEENRGKLEEDQSILKELVEHKEIVENKKREVEDSIMRAMSVTPSPETANGINGDAAGDQDPEKPEVEGFTPPPPQIETFTPPPQDTLTGDPAPFIGGDNSEEHNLSSATGAENIYEQPLRFNEPPPAFEPPPALPDESSAQAASRFLDSFHLPAIRQASSEVSPEATNGVTADPRTKRRKMTHHAQDVDEDIFGGANSGVDEEGVTAILGQ